MTVTPDPPGRGAIVTGGGSGIGEQIVRQLADDGYAVLILDIDARAEAVAADLAARGGHVSALRCDVADSASVAAAFDGARSVLPGVDVLVNNAGISLNQGIRRLDDESWARTIAVNLTGALHCAREAARVMVLRKQGAIVNIASRAWLGWFGQTSYASSKGGLVSMTRSLAIELARHGIRVNCIAPGLIDTPLLQGESEAVRARLMAAQPMGRIGTTSDVAWATRYLSGDLSSGVTGQVLYVCGGKSLFAAPG
jgi:NAD(P)-dependent dehydrogenase (short-subunit alcohol dehydrogenase family)